MNSLELDMRGTARLPSELVDVELAGRETDGGQTVDFATLKFSGVVVALGDDR